MKKVILILLFIFALFLRVYRLDRYPVGLLWDEAALGYNAYSILKTGRDEYGQFLPIIFKSFGDYKPGFYVYLTIPFVAVLGLTEMAVRLPSAIFGALAVVLLYLVIKETKKEKLALIASLLLAISPWHLRFSRGAWELNIMLTEIILGLYFLMKMFSSKKSVFSFLAAGAFILSLITYQSAKLLSPLIILGFLFFFRHEFKENKKRIFHFLAIFMAMFIVFNLITVLGGKAGRIKVMSLFSYPRSDAETQMILGQGDSPLDWAVFHSRPFFFTRSVVGRYLNHFSGKFLLFAGDWSNRRNGIIYHGVLYPIEGLFLLAGLGFLFGRKRSPLENFMLYWLVLAPLPAALTRDSISSVRSFTMVIPLVFFIATGILELAALIKQKFPRLISPFYLLLTICYLLLFFRLVDLYFIHDPLFASDNYLYGYKEVMSYVAAAKNKDKIVITPKYGQPYIFYLFYTGYDPAKYQRVARLKENPFGDVGEVEKLDNIEFRKIYWPADRGIVNSLFIGDEFQLPLKDVVGEENKFVHLKDINFFDSKVAFRVVETK